MCLLSPVCAVDLQDRLNSHTHGAMHVLADALTSSKADQNETHSPAASVKQSIVEGHAWKLVR